MDKPCVVCGTVFDARGSAKGCSPACRKEHRRRANTAYLRSIYHRRYTSKLKGVRRACVVCDAEYTPRGHAQTTCGAPACVKEKTRRYRQQPDQRAKRLARARAYYASPAGRAAAERYGRSAKAKANAERYRAEGRTKEYSRASRRRARAAAAAAELARLAAELGDRV